MISLLSPNARCVTQLMYEWRVRPGWADLVDLVLQAGIAFSQQALLLLSGLNDLLQLLFFPSLLTFMLLRD